MSRSGSGARVIALYVAMVMIPLGIAIIALSSGGDRTTAVPVAGTYALKPAPPCLGDQMVLQQSGQFVDATSPTSGKLRIDGTRLTGSVVCKDGSSSDLVLSINHKSATDITLSGTIGSTSVTASLVKDTVVAAATQKRSNEETFGRLMLAIAVVIIAARLLGAAIKRVGQPQVMGEVLAGILLGPTLLGSIASRTENYFFPSDIVPLLSGAADIGLAFYMFLVGLELDPNQLRGRIAQSALISNASVAIPITGGILVAIPIYGLLAPDKPFVAFALFMGVAMSITAFPVLARILVERRMLKQPVGAMALASAAIDDVTAWGLLALATAVAGSGSTLNAVRVVGLTALFCAGMGLIARPLLARVSSAYDEAGSIPIGWIATIFVGVLLSAFLAQTIGVAAIFGAFIMGFIMPRRADLTHDVTRRVEDFVVTVLLPLFFVVTGLKTDVGLLNRPELWLIGLGLLGIAIAGKWLGAMTAAVSSGFGWREAVGIGALMNTRGLTELIVLNIGRDLGVISPSLFAMLVLMALITTLMTGPALRIIDPKMSFSAATTEAFRAAEVAAPEAAPARAAGKAILVTSEDSRNLAALLALAAPLALSPPPREVVIARLVVPTRLATGLAGDDRDLQKAATELTELRGVLTAQGIATRAAAFTTGDAGADMVRLAEQAEIDLVLVDGRRPFLGEGVPRGSVGVVLAKAPCDVAVLVERESRPPELGPERAVIVPFGGAEHDWAALELGAWIAHAKGAPLKLLGAAADIAEGKRDASRLLASASLVVQQLAGVSAEPVLTDPGRDGVLKAAEGAGLLVVGLSDRWRDEGLGPVRSAIARSAESPVLFVRRGTRSGALAPRDNATRFSWSMVGPAPKTPAATPPPAGGG